VGDGLKRATVRAADQLGRADRRGRRPHGLGPLALLIFPATFLAITLFCFNFIGAGLRDALDPKDR
jgi:oligopeptide transport system permease protein